VTKNRAGGSRRLEYAEADFLAVEGFLAKPPASENEAEASAAVVDV